MERNKHLEQEADADYHEKRLWKMNLDRLRGGLAISAFFMVFCFVLSAFLGLFQYDTSPGSLDTRGLSFSIYWFAFLGYVCWKFHEIWVLRGHNRLLRNRTHQRRSDLTIQTFPKEEVSVLLEIIRLRVIKALFIFGLLYSILLLALRILKL